MLAFRCQSLLCVQNHLFSVTLYSQLLLTSLELWFCLSPVSLLERMTTYLSFLAVVHSWRLAPVNTAFQEVSKSLWISTYSGTLGPLGWFSNLDANYRFPFKPSFSLFPVLYPHWFFSIFPFYFHLISFFYCMHACTHIPWSNKMSEESFLSPDRVCDFWGLNTDWQAWWQVPLLTEPSCPFLRFVFSYSSGLSCSPPETSHLWFFCSFSTSFLASSEAILWTCLFRVIFSLDPSHCLSLWWN